MSARPRWAWAGAAAASVALAAQAYIPTVSTLLHRAASRVEEGGRSRRAQLTGTLTLGQAPAVAATLTLHFPLSCKLDAAGIAVAVGGEAGAQQVTDDGHPGARDLLRLACPLIAYRGQGSAAADHSLRLAAAAAGVTSLTPTSLSRLYDRVVVVLAAQPRQLDRPQLWLYKENAAPARLLSRAVDGLDDLRLLQYGNPAAADWLPRVIELWHGESMVARFDVLETSGFRDAAEEGDDDVRD